MIYIRESYNTKGIFLEKTIFYYKAIEEFVFDYNYFLKEEKDGSNYYDFKPINNGYEIFKNERLWVKGYLVEKE